MIDYKRFIAKYYVQGSALETILLTHCRGVSALAIECYERNRAMFDSDPSLKGVDARQMIHTAAMLHDIGICLCNAPGIECYGSEPYICHGRLGAEMLRSTAKEWGISAEEIEPFARVCERHTGAGLTAKDITEQNLPLPAEDMLPETLVEKLVCYADKFYSKTHPEQRKTLERAEKSIAKFGNEGFCRFKDWEKLFGI